VIAQGLDLWKRQRKFVDQARTIGSYRRYKLAFCDFTEFVVLPQRKKSGIHATFDGARRQLQDERPGLNDFR